MAPDRKFKTFTNFFKILFALLKIRLLLTHFYFRFNTENK